MYSTALRHCTRGECQDVCAQEGGTWFTPLPNFDTTPDGIWALFVITTLENWNDVMYNMVDSRGVLLQPVQRERLGWSWRQDFAAVFIFAFIAVNVILLTNLFVGVVCSEFQSAKQRKERLTNLTAEQREWVLVHDLLTHHGPTRLPREPAHDAPAIQQWCFRVFYHGPFAPPLANTSVEQTTEPPLKHPGGADGAAAEGTTTKFRHKSRSASRQQRRMVSAAEDWGKDDKREASFYIEVCVFTINMVSLGCVAIEYWGMTAQYELILCYIQSACSALLWLNILAKVVAIGLPLYWTVSFWNRLELVLEIVTPAYCSCTIASLHGIPGAAHRSLRLLGAARTFRSFRLLQLNWLDTVSGIMHALFVSLPAVANLVVLIVFVVIAFDFIGVSLFGGAVIADAYPDGDGLSDDLNFSNLGNGFLTLCVLMRFEGWTALWADLMRAEYTDIAPPKWTVYAFFMIFLVFAVYMMLSVFIALLLDTLEQLNAASGNTVDQRAIRKFAERWSELDPSGDQMIDSAQLGALLRGLGPPFVSGSEVADVQSLTKLLMHLDLPVYVSEGALNAQNEVISKQAEVTYLEVVYALAKRAVFADEPELYELEPHVERMVLSKLPKAFPIVRYLSSNRKFTSEFAVAHAIAQVGFDPLLSIRPADLDDDDDHDAGLFSNSDDDDINLGMRRPARAGSMRFVAV